MSSPRSKLSAAWAVEAASLEGRYSKKTKTSLANLVQVAIRQNCGELSAYETDHLVVEGLTLRQRVTQDKEKKQNNPQSVIMGKAYWEQLRKMYTSNSSELKQLGAVHVQSIPKKLFDAVSKTRQRIPDRRSLAEYASSAESITKPSDQGLGSGLDEGDGNHGRWQVSGAKGVPRRVLGIAGQEWA
eukprot:6475424-Amphidinium_carterae.3